MQDTTDRFTCALCGDEARRPLEAEADTAAHGLCDTCVDRWRRDVQAAW
jgi:ribosome-binding protein aMBF1 (putative translation factor)